MRKQERYFLFSFDSTYCPGQVRFYPSHTNNILAIAPTIICLKEICINSLSLFHLHEMRRKSSIESSKKMFPGAS